MTAERKKQYIAGSVLILAVAAFILTVFSLLSRTEEVDLYLQDTRGERFGWRYELLVDDRAQAYDAGAARGDRGGAHHPHHGRGHLPG